MRVSRTLPHLCESPENCLVFNLLAATFSLMSSPEQLRIQLRASRVKSHAEYRTHFCSLYWKNFPSIPGCLVALNCNFCLLSPGKVLQALAQGILLMSAALRGTHHAECLAQLEHFLSFQGLAPQVMTAFACLRWSLISSKTCCCCFFNFTQILHCSDVSVFSIQLWKVGDLVWNKLTPSWLEAQVLFLCF